MKVALGSDHAGYTLKLTIIEYLSKLGYEVNDFGPYNAGSVDYPDIGANLARAVANQECERGILLCGTGIGMSITANKIAGVRAALCNDIFTARMSRKHNDANVLTLGARVVGLEVALAIVYEWLNTDFEGGRHSGRLAKITALETNPAS